MTTIPDTGTIRVAVLDIDGSIVAQHGTMQAYRPVIIPARDLHDELRYWSTHEALDRLHDRVLQYIARIENTFLLYGSSDFPNLTYLWLRMLRTPVSVIHFDNHSDWVRVPPRDAVHAGSWVRHALALPQVATVSQLGVDGDLQMQLVPPTPTGPLTHDFHLFESGRLETFPNALERATYLGAVTVPPQCGVADQGVFTTTVRWNTIRRHGMQAVMSSVLDRIPTDSVYISVDKDVLRDEDCFTNFYRWQQGTVRLSELTDALRLIRRRKTIVAMDINGDASPATFGPGRMAKQLFALKDRKLTPAMFADASLAALNDASNLALLRSVGASEPGASSAGGV